MGQLVKLLQKRQLLTPSDQLLSGNIKILPKKIGEAYISADLTILLSLKAEEIKKKILCNIRRQQG